METTITVVNDAGDAFTVKLIPAGGRYGRNGKLVATRAMVEFYDAEFAGVAGFAAEGQYVSGYYVHSLTGSEFGNSPARLCQTGLVLDGRTPKWRVSGANVAAIFAWLGVLA